MTTLHTTPIQALFENSNLELDLSKNADGHYLNEVARYAWINWTTAYSFGREHRWNILNKDIEIALAEANAQPEPVEPQQAAYPQAYDKSLYCQVNKDGEPAKRMLRTDAQKLQAELGDTVEWLLNGFTKPSLGGFDFGTDGIYTYRAKPAKEVAWADVPVGVAVTRKSFDESFIFMGLANGRTSMARLFHKVSPTIGLQTSELKLAPASDQPWIATQQTFERVEGLIYEVKADAGCGTSPHDIAVFRISGLAEGYVMEKAK